MWAHNITTCTAVCLRWPGRGQGLLLQSRARKMAAGTSRGGLASEPVLGEWAVGHTIVFWRESSFYLYLQPHLFDIEAHGNG